MPPATPTPAAGFDPERHARRLAPPGAALCVLAAAFGWPAAAVLAPAGLALLLVACYSRTDGLLVLGPFVRAESIRAARSRRPHLWRSLYAAGVLALLGLTYWNVSERYWGPTPPRAEVVLQRVAVTFFAWFVALQFAYLAYLTVNLIGPVVAEERETKRLDFLLSTDLRNREFLLGKAAARVPMLLDPLLASLPVLALLPFFGGVPPGFVVAAGVGTLATVMSLAGVAAFFSAVAPNSAKAIEWTYGMGMFYLVTSGVLWACAVWPPLWHFPSWLGLPGPFDLSDVVRVVSTGNPLVAFFLAVKDLEAGADPETTWQDAAGRYAVFHVGAFALFGLTAVARVRRAAAWDLERKPPAAPEPEPDADEPAGESEAAPESRPTRRRGVVRRVLYKRRPIRPPVGDHPVLWYEAFRTSGLAGGTWAHEIGRPVFFGVLVVVAFNVLQLLFPQARELADAGVSLAFWGMGLAAMIAVPNRASGVIAHERQVDTLEGLMLTGMGCREILRQKWWGVFAAHRALFATMLGTALAGMLTGNLHPGTVVSHLVMVPVYLAAGAAVGLYFSVRMRRRDRAGWATMTFIVLALFAVGTVAGRATHAGRFNDVGGVAAVPPFATAMAAMGPIDWRRGRGGPPDGLAAAVGLSLAAYAAVAGLFWRLAGDRFEAEWERRG